MNDCIRLGMFGLGNVGIGVVRLLSRNQAIIDERVGTPLRLEKIVVKDLSKDRGVDLSGIRLSDDPGLILNDPDIHIVVEVMGGLDMAEQVILESLKNGKSVVTANKALLAEKGASIFSAASEAKGHFGFESSVGTAIPIVRALKDGFAGDEIMSISGIINGTSNYILTRMAREGMEFNDALKRAQKEGLAEADPVLDVQGIDAAHKLIIMMTIAFGERFDFSALPIEGISKIRSSDVRYTKEMGYTIKHLGMARKTDQGIEARVHPVLLYDDHILSSVNDAFNSVFVHGRFMGPSLLYGLGAGPGPSATGVISDVIEACTAQMMRRQSSLSQCSISKKNRISAKIMPMDRVVSKYYLRFHVKDTIGVLAGISNILAKNRISVRSVIQKGDDICPEGTIDVVLITHEAVEADVQNAVRQINHQPFIADTPQLIRIHQWEESSD